MFFISFYFWQYVSIYVEYLQLSKEIKNVGYTHTINTTVYLYIFF